MKKFKLTSLLFLFAFAIVSTTYTSCGDDEPETVMGCTDEDADNYNANANSEDDSCTFFGRFEGVYDGTFGCGLLPFNSVVLTISQSAGSTDVLAMSATSTLLPFPIPLRATITDKNTMVVSQPIPSVDLSSVLPDPPYGADLRWNIQIDGTLVRQADDSFEGSLDFVLTEVNGDAAEINDTCTFVAVPQ